MRILLLLIFPALCTGQARQISFGVKVDTTGVYFITQLVTVVNDTTRTTADAIRFESAAAAIPVVQSTIAAVQRDSAEIQAMYRNTMRQLIELRQGLSALQPQAQQQTTPLTAEQELARLREENERLKRAQKKE
jgi:hypothetical protein